MDGSDQHRTFTQPTAVCDLCKTLAELKLSTNRMESTKHTEARQHMYLFYLEPSYMELTSTFCWLNPTNPTSVCEELGKLPASFHGLPQCMLSSYHVRDVCHFVI